MFKMLNIREKKFLETSVELVSVSDTHIQS